MPRSSLSYALISDAALGSLSARKVESGSPHITVGAYLALLDVFGLPTAFDRVLARGDDTLGEALGRNAMRKRARSPLATEADEFDI
jgi:hypothetical protein